MTTDPAPGWACGACSGNNPAGTRFCGHCGAPSAGGPAVAEVLRSFVTEQVADRLEAGGGAVPQERRLVTALFADLSGFTRLAGALDTEDLMDVIDPVITGLTDVVGRYGGYVEKFAGDALLAFFGAPVAREDDAQRALLVALEMHQTLPGLAPAGVDLTLHVGINTGHVVARLIGSSVRLDYGVLGESVVLAQRLESVAPSGQTYVGETTVRLVGGEFALEEVPPVTVKGRDAPLRAWRLTGLGSGSAGPVEQPLRERDDALAAGHSLAGQVAGGGCGVLDVVADRGLGSTALLGALRGDPRVHWFATTCSTHGADAPYWPVTRLLETLLPEPGPSGLDRLLRGLGLARLLPVLGELFGMPVPSQDLPTPESVRRAVHGAVREVLDGVAGRPWVLVLDQADRADPSTLELARSLLSAPRRRGRRRGRRPAAGDRAAAGRRAAATTASRRCRPPPPPRWCSTTLRPDRWTGRSSTRSSRAAAATRASPSSSCAACWLRPRRGGAGARATALAQLPLTVEALLPPGSTGCPSTARGSCRRAPCWPRRCRATCSTPSPRPLRVPAGIAALAAADMVDAQAAAVRWPSRCRSCSRWPCSGSSGATGRCCMPGPPTPSSCCTATATTSCTCSPSTATGPATTPGPCRCCADRPPLGGLLCRTPRRSASWAGRSRSPGARVSRCPTCCTTSATCSSTSATTRRQQPRTPRRSSWPTTSAAGAGWPRCAGRRVTRRRQRRSPPGRWPPRPRQTGGCWSSSCSWAASVQGRADDAVAAAEPGLAAGPDDAVAGRLLLQVVRARTLQGRDGDALSAGTRALALLEPAGDLRGLAGGLRLLGNAHERAGRLDDAAALLRRGLAVAERVGSVEELAGCLVNLGLVAHARGEHAAAGAAYRRAADEFALVGNRRGTAVAWGNLAETLCEAGDLEGAEAAAERAGEHARAVGYLLVEADATATRSELATRRGDHERAAALAQAAADTAGRAGAVSYQRDFLARSARAWQAAGRPDRAAAVLMSLDQAPSA